MWIIIDVHLPGEHYWSRGVRTCDLRTTVWETSSFYFVGIFPNQLLQNLIVKLIRVKSYLAVNKNFRGKFLCLHTAQKIGAY